MTSKDVARMLVKKLNIPYAEDYDAVLRECDDQIEVIGLIPDPNFEPEQFDRSKYNKFFPKCWTTLAVVPASMRVK